MPEDYHPREYNEGEFNEIMRMIDNGPVFGPMRTSAKVLAEMVLWFLEQRATDESND